MKGYRKTKLGQKVSLTVNGNYMIKKSPGSRSPSVLHKEEKEEMETENFTFLGSR